MHYDKVAYSNGNGNTIVPKDPKYLDLIGQRLTANAQDMAILDKMYEDLDGQTDISQCKCQEFSVSGFSVQWSCNGSYKFDSISNGKNSFVTDSYYGPRYINFKKYGSKPKWTCRDDNEITTGERGGAYDAAFCVEDISSSWEEWTGTEMKEVPVKIECTKWAKDSQGRKEKRTGLCPTDEDKFIWEINNWNHMFEKTIFIL